MSNKRQNKNRPKNPTPKFDICQVIYFYLRQQEDKVRHEGKKEKKITISVVLSINKIFI